MLPFLADGLFDGLLLPPLPLLFLGLTGPSRGECKYAEPMPPRFGAGSEKDRMPEVLRDDGGRRCRRGPGFFLR